MMRISCILYGLLLAIVIVNCSPIVKRETEEDELSPLNEVYVVEADNDTDGDRGDRDKRKVVVGLGITNGILNFVFGKLDSFLDAKTKALTVHDEANKVKNAAFGIDPNHSATSQFLSNTVSQAIQGATGAIGPIINSATTLLSGVTAGLTNTFASKLAPLSSLSGGILGGGLSGGGGANAGASPGGGAPAGSAVIGDLLTTGLNSFTSLSSSSSGGLSGGLGGGGTGASTGGSGTSADASAGTGAGVNLGAFANLGGKRAITTTTTTTEDTPVFDRKKVSLVIPSNAFATGFTLVTDISKVLNNVILNSARRTQTFLEIFKPFFRGSFAIKGLPSDNKN